MATSTVPMSGPYVKQHKRMAAGEKVDGKTLPPAPGPKTPQTPCISD